MKSEFGSLKRKIFIQVMIVGAVSIFAALFFRYALIDGVFERPFAEGFVKICMRILDTDYYAARDIYHQLFRRQKTVLMLCGFIFLLLIIFYILLFRFTKYFKEISRGIDMLVAEKEGRIEFSPELNFMERKINTIKKTLEKRERDAKEAEQRKNDLVVYLAHDIKTPLTSVIGYLSLLDEAPDMPAEQREKYVDITLKKALRLEELISEFFEITRFNLQSIPLNKEQTDLTQMLMQLADEFYPILEQKGNKAEVLGEDNLVIYCDVNKLARVFNNLLRNAASYSYSNSTVKIQAYRQGNQAVVTFGNPGNTIPEDKLNSIFEKFYRLDESRGSQTGGAGLGLAIAKEIVEAHDGSITAESSNDYTIFKVLLPIDSDTTAPQKKHKKDTSW